MKLQNEEEKKEATGWGDDISGSSSRNCTENTISDDEDDDQEELGDLPPSIAKHIDEHFNSEEELEAALVKAGVGDLPVVLVDGKPRLVMPSDQHNFFTSKYDKNFTFSWAKNKWGYSSASHKLHLQNGRSRDPDLSYWGYPRCRYDHDGDLVPVDDGKGSVPDVVIQFSWKNTAKYEEDAINDMMSRALEKNGGTVSTRPHVGYLIKIRFSKKRTVPGGLETQDVDGLDIYRLAHGTTLADARNPNNPNATYMRYYPTGPEYFITITAGDLGFTGFWAFLCGDYKIKASAIFRTMRQLQQERQADGLAT